MKESEYMNTGNLTRIRIIQEILRGIHSVEDEHSDDKAEIYRILERMEGRCKQRMGQLSLKD